MRTRLCASRRPERRRRTCRRSRRRGCRQSTTRPSRLRLCGVAVHHVDGEVRAAGERALRVVVARGLGESRENDEQRERHCHQCRYERNLRESHFYPPCGAVVLGLALSPRAGWSVIPLYPCPCAPRVLALRGMAGMLLSNDSRRPCNRMHRAVLAKPLDMSLRQHATLFLPAQRPRVNAGAGTDCGGVRPIAERAAPARCLVIPAEAGIQCGRQATLVALSRPGTHPAPHSRSTPHLPVAPPRACAPGFQPPLE